MMRKIASVCLMSAAVVLSLSSCSHFEKTVTKKIPTEVPPKLVFMGDSIPAGYGLEGYSYDDVYQSRSYCNIIGDEYKAELKDSCGHEMINLAHTGQTSLQMLEMLSGGECDEALRGSDVVVISIGGNDLLDQLLEYVDEYVGYDYYNGGDIDLEEVDFWGAITGFGKMGDDMDVAMDDFDEKLPQIISKVESLTDGEIYVQTLYDPFEDVHIPFVASMASEKIGRLNSIVNSHADDGSTHHYTVIDLVPEFRGRSKELTNISNIDIHPNAQGHELIAKLVDEQLRKGSYGYDTEVVVTDVPKLAAVIGISAAVASAALFGIIARVKKRRSHSSSPDKE